MKRCRKPRLVIAPMLFVLGALIGSNLLSLVGSNQYLLKLLLQTWQTYLFAYGWWPWPLTGGILLCLGYLLWPRQSNLDRKSP